MQTSIFNPIFEENMEEIYQSLIQETDQIYKTAESTWNCYIQLDGKGVNQYLYDLISTRR